MAPGPGSMSGAPMAPQAPHPHPHPGPPCGMYGAQMMPNGQMQPATWLGNKNKKKRGQKLFTAWMSEVRINGLFHLLSILGHIGVK